MKTIIWIFAFLIISVIAANADDAKRNCYPITGKDLIRADSPKFSDYPAVVKKISKPAKVKLNSQTARNRRTMLREGTKRGPRFAGHYAIATWGCGSGCIDFALIDLITGKVIFPDGIIPITITSLVEADDFDAENIPQDEGEFRCRNDSRLLIVVGSIEDGFADKDRTGAFYYVLENEKLKKIFETKVRKDDCFNEDSSEPSPARDR